MQYSDFTSWLARVKLNSMLRESRVLASKGDGRGSQVHLLARKFKAYVHGELAYCMRGICRVETVWQVINKGFYIIVHEYWVSARSLRYALAPNPFKSDHLRWSRGLDIPILLFMV